MRHIVVDDEQARLIAQSGERIEVRDQRGNPLGIVVPAITAEDIAIAKQRLASDQPRFTTEQMLDYLASLEPR